MKRILLTTTSLVLAAGVAQADITWSGSATAGLARDGKVKAAAAATATDANYLLAKADSDAAVTDLADYRELILVNAKTTLNSLRGAASAANATDVTTDADVADGTAHAALRAAIVAEIAALGASTLAADVATQKADLVRLNGLVSQIDSVFGTAATATGKMKQYSEVNATASASVATDMGWTVTAAISVDAGTGYDFADDDTFDGAKTNGVGLDSVSIDFGAGGKLTLDQNAVAHLVDADDDAAADLLYTNTFGTASVSIAADIDDGDSDTKASKASSAFIDAAVSGTNLANETLYTAAVAADTQWSAKVSMPLAGTNVYFAADEAGGDAYGVSGTYMGIGWSVDSKREALAKDTGAKRSNTVGVSYVAGALTLGATYDSIKDGNQWGVTSAYAAGALTLNVSTNEADSWSASGAYDLGNGASLVGGTNYTEDAYVGVSFAF